MILSVQRNLHIGHFCPLQTSPSDQSQLKIILTLGRVTSLAVSGNSVDIKDACTFRQTWRGREKKACYMSSKFIIILNNPSLNLLKHWVWEVIFYWKGLFKASMFLWGVSGQVFSLLLHSIISSKCLQIKCLF